MKSGSNLERLLSDGHFVVTAEVGPPKSADPTVIQKKAQILNGYVDAANITDNQAAMVRLSSLAGSKLLLDEGVEPVMQMVVRDRNQIALQSDIMGAYALGIRNTLCLYGDPVKVGNHPEAKEVHDLKTAELITLFRDMRDDKVFLTRDEIKSEPRFFIGAAADPFAPKLEWRVDGFGGKCDAGADFFQTQAVFDLEGTENWLTELSDAGHLGRVPILLGIIPLKSLKMAKYMNENIPGIEVPQGLMDRISNADKPEEEGIKISIELIDGLRKMKGVNGVHIMAVAWESKVPEIVSSSGLHPRPKPS